MLEFSGESPSHLACKNGHINVMKVLSAFDCLKFRDPDINGISSLTYAALNGHTEIVNIYRNIEKNFEKILKRKEIQMKMCKKFKHNHSLHGDNEYNEIYYCNYVKLFKCSKCNNTTCDGHTSNYPLPNDYIENVEFRFLYSTDSEDDEEGPLYSTDSEHDEEGPAAKKTRKFSITVL